MKTYKNVLIAIMDGVQDDSGDFMDATTKVSWVTPYVDIMPNATGPAWPIGKAENIRMEQNKLYADLEFFDEPDQSVLVRVPSFFGKEIARMASHLTEVKLEAVGMAKENYDKRIPALSTYGSGGGSKAPDVYSYKVSYVTDTPVAERACTCERLIFGHSEGCPWTK